jgi:hypothetical protein
LSLPFNSLFISDEQRDVVMALVKAYNNPGDVMFNNIIAKKKKTKHPFTVQL